jgi:F-type H+-transporting ATPase subunit delta
VIRSFARPYARAILEVAGTVDVAETIHRELTTFEHTRGKSPELVEVFANPAFSTDVKLAVASDIAKRLGLGDLAGRVIQVLVQNHRINRLGSILEALRAAINEKTGRVVAHVKSAHDLTDDERNELRNALEARFGTRVELEVETDQTLLGGFVAQLGSEVYDASVIGQLGKLRESLS